MKIAYVTMQFPVASETFAAVEIRVLRRLGAEVSVLAYRRAPEGAARMLAERGLADLPVDHGGPAATLRGLALIFLRPGDSLPLLATILTHCRRHPLHLLKALTLLPRSLGLLQKLEALQPDVVHLFWGHYPSLLGLLVLRRLPRTAVTQFLGAYDLERGFPLSELLARRAGRLLTHAKANLPALAAIGVKPEEVEVSYRGIELPATPPAPRKVPALMVVAERLVPQKQTAEALRLFAAVAEQVPEARLRVLGDGPESARLKALAANLGVDGKVTFCGHVPHREVFRHLEAAEVALTLSRSASERLPNAIKEAMLYRCLCLAAHSPGIEELIADGETGLLATPEDTTGTAQRLVALLRDRDAAAEMGRKAQAHVMAHFNVDRLMTERLKLWSALTAGRRQGEAA